MAGFLSASLAWGKAPPDDPIWGIADEWYDASKATRDAESTPDQLVPCIKRQEAIFLRYRQWLKQTSDPVWYSYEQQREAFELANFRMGSAWLRAGNVEKAISHLKAEIALGGYLLNTRNRDSFAISAFGFHAAILAAGGDILTIPGSGYQVFPVPAEGGKPGYVFAHEPYELSYHEGNFGEEGDKGLRMVLFSPNENGVYYASSQAEVLARKGHRVSVDCRMEEGYRILVLKGVDKIIEYHGDSPDFAVAKPIPRTTLELRAKGKTLEQPAEAFARTPAGRRAAKEEMAAANPAWQIVDEWHRAYRHMLDTAEPLEPAIGRLEAATLRFQHWQEQQGREIEWRSKQDQIELADFRLALAWMRAGNATKALEHLSAEFARNGEGLLTDSRGYFDSREKFFGLHADILGAGVEALSIPHSGYEVFPVPCASGKPSYVFAYRATGPVDYDTKRAGVNENDHLLFLCLMAPHENGGYFWTGRSQVIAAQGEVAISSKIENDGLLLLLRGVGKIVDCRIEPGFPAIKPSKHDTIELQARAGFLEKPADVLARMDGEPEKE